MKRVALVIAALLIAAAPLGRTQTAPKYDLLLRGGHVIDARNNIDAIRDVAIKDGKIAGVAAKIDPAEAGKTVDVCGPLRHAGTDRHPRPRVRGHR